MKHFTPTPSRRNVRVILATLLSYLMLVGQAAPLALAANSPAMRAAPAAKGGAANSGEASRLKSSAAAPAPLSPAATTVTATKTDSFPDPDGDGNAAPGEEISYEVTVGASGGDATNVQFTDTVDPDTTFVPGSVTMSPLARNDTYNATLDTQLVVATAQGVLANDTGIPTPTATAIASGATTGGGTVTLNTDGSFTYTPASGYQGADTFTYTATNGNSPDDTATVTINVDAAPTVQSTTPANNATGVANNANVAITFSEPVNVTGSWFTISCATSGAHTATVTPNGTNTVFTLNPNSDFADGEQCTVTVVAAQVTDQDTNDPPDNMAADYVFSFTVDAAPTVQSTSPTNGATTVATNTNITVTFSEPVDATTSSFTIECPAPGNLKTFTVSGSGTSTITLDPTLDLPEGTTCKVTVVANQISDSDTADPPDHLASDYVFSFTTDSAPTVTGTTPTNGATQVASNTNVTITFSEPVNVTGSWFTISCATSLAHTAVVTPNGTNTVFTLNPDTDFTNGELCTVTIDNTKVADQDAGDPPDNMAAPYVFSFTIDVPPSVSTTSPLNNATGVSPSTDIAITFSEPVNVTGNWFQLTCAGGATIVRTVNPADATITPSGGNTVFTINPTTDLPEGVICTTTVFAAQVADQDAGDPPDNMTANYVFSFKVPPRAVADARNATGNVRIVTTGRSNFTVLANDFYPASDPVTVTAFDSSSAHGGNVAIVSNTGTFSYNPPPGYEGTDTFNYTITNLAGSSTATVTITIAGMIWFIDDSASACTVISPATGCGRLTNPLSTLPSFEAANGNADVVATNVYNPAANDNIFIYSGSYTGPLTLENNQHVIGQGATGTLTGAGSLTGVTPATDSDALPSITGQAADRPSIGTGGFTLASGNLLDGLAFSNTAGAAITNASGASVGTLTLTEIGINNSGSGGAGITLTNGGTVTATGTNTINTRSAVGLNVTNTTIGAGNMTFKSISVGNNDANADPANGIVLNTTGASGSLIVTGNNTNTVGGDASGGTIQNTTGDAISLTSTLSPSFTNVTISFNPAVQVSGSGVHGTQVTNFTFKNSTVSNTGHNLDTTNTFIGESDLRFDTQLAGTENNLSGAVTITNNVLNNALTDGVRIYNFNGTISDLNVSNNSLTSGTTTGTNGSSKGTGINIQILGSGTTVSNLTKATIANNTIANFPGGAGIQVQGGNASTTGTGGTVGTPGNATNVVSITGNNIHGQSSANRMGTSAILVTVGGGRSSSRSQGNFNISSNGTVANPLTNVSGLVIGAGANGFATVTVTVDNNRIVANHPAASTAANGISIAGGVVTGGSDTPDLTATVTNNNISQTDGNGILAVTRGVSGFLKISIKSNTVAAPLSGNRGGIRVDAGNLPSVDDAVCLDIQSNTSAGSGVETGIELRKQGTSPTVNDFGIEGMAATASPGVEAYVNGLNPAGGGTTLISATSGFTNCSSAPVAPTAPVGSSVLDTPTLIDGGDSTTPSASGEPSATTPVDESTNVDAGQPVPESAPVESAPAAAPVTAAPATAAPAVTTPRRARVWSDIPVIITRTPSSDSSTGDKPARDEEDSAKDDSQPKDGASAADNPQPADDSQATDSGAAPKKATKKPAKRKKAGEQRKQVAQPETKDIVYFGPLGSAPSRSARFERASYEAGDAVRASYEAGDAVAPSARKVTAKPAAKATAAAARAVALVVGPQVNVPIGTLPSGKSVKIRFRVTVNDPFGGPAQQVSNQGTVTADGGISVLTDDPSAPGASDPTVTPVKAIYIRANDAKLAEPASGTAQMLFTVSLSTPAPATGVTVSYATADGTATGGAACGGTADYLSVPPTPLTFSSGQQVKTVPVTVCSDSNNSESNETLTLTISSPSDGSITNAAATGTITTAEAAGSFLISELRTRGAGPAPGGGDDADDDFVELYNNTTSELVVTSSDGSAGYGVFKMGSDCSAAPVLVGVIPNNTKIPARGHYLLTGSTYSLADYGGTGAAAGDGPLTSDIEDDRNVAVFSTASVANVSTSNRLDAVGFGTNTSSVCAVMREGANLAPVGAAGADVQGSYFRKECDYLNGVPCKSNGYPKDSNSNSADFMFADTNMTSIAGVTRRLGAPGPENLSSPIRRDDAGVLTPLLDATVDASLPPNRVRNTTPGDPNTSAAGTLDIRRRIQNTTANTITRMRFRVIDLTTGPTPPTGTADLRGITTPLPIPVINIMDAATCAAAPGSPSPPCSVTVQPTALETPPAQAKGGGYNSTFTVDIPGGLAPGASVDVNFKFGVMQTGSFHFYFVVEALP
jgi:methionine-rich copper-binding protein CopC